MAGVVIDAFPLDDYDNNCKCGPFAATQAIDDGLRGRPENTSLTCCTSFGNLPTNSST